MDFSKYVNNLPYPDKSVMLKAALAVIDETPLTKADRIRANDVN